jgi:hypothetical protein
MTRYYRSFPPAPVAIVSGVSFAALIPTIVDARVCRDSSVILEVFQSDDFRLNVDRLNAIAEFFDSDPADVFVESVDGEAEMLVVSVLDTAFDFSAQFVGRPEKGASDRSAVAESQDSFTPSVGDGTEDSDEPWEASEALQRHLDRRG